VTGEMKYMDSDLNATAIVAVTTTWPAGTMMDPQSTINLGSGTVAFPLGLCQPTVGSALNNRVGRKITVQKIKIHGKINVPAQVAQATGDSACKIRVVLCQDQQTNAAPMTGAQLFNDATGPVTAVQSFQNPNNFGRFRVLKDKFFQISDLNLAGSAAAGDLTQAS